MAMRRLVEHYIAAGQVEKAVPYLDAVIQQAGQSQDAYWSLLMPGVVLS